MKNTRRVYVFSIFLSLFLVTATVSCDFSTPEPTDNLLWTENSVIPAHGTIISDSNPCPMVIGTAPSGVDAVIVSAQYNNGGNEYRFCIDFAQPLNIDGYKTLYIEWEALDESMESGTNMNSSIFTLTKADNKLYSKGTLDFANRDATLDKKSILEAHGGFQTSKKADFNFNRDETNWTDTTVNDSTKEVTRIEMYISKAGTSLSNLNGVAVTNVWFE